MNDTVSRRMDVLERKLDSVQRRLARRDRAGRWAGAVALAAAVTTPMIAWTYSRPHAAFEPGTPIQSGQVNETIDDIYVALNTLDVENQHIRASAVIDAMGALPASGDFSTDGGTVLLFVSGSAWRSDVAGFCGVDVLVDGTSAGSVRVYTNEITSHKSLASTPVVLTQLGAGPHTVELVALAGTASDLNDVFRVVVLELAR